MNVESPAFRPAGCEIQKENNLYPRFVVHKGKINTTRQAGFAAQAISRLNCNHIAADDSEIKPNCDDCAALRHRADPLRNAERRGGSRALHGSRQRMNGLTAFVIRRNDVLSLGLNAIF